MRQLALFLAALLGILGLFVYGVLGDWQLAVVLLLFAILVKPSDVAEQPKPVEDDEEEEKPAQMMSSRMGPK